jgi:hypothetical protein
VVGLVVEDQVGVEPVGRGPAERQAGRAGVGRAQVAAAQHVRDRAVTLLVAAGETYGEGVAERHVGHALEQAVAVVAQLGAHAPVQRLRVGLVLDDVDRADHRAAPEQGRLRALGHLDALVVEQLDIRAARLGDRHAVLEHRDARLDRGLAAVGGDAAHHEARVVGRLVLDLEAGHEGRQLVEVLHAQLAPAWRRNRRSGRSARRWVFCSRFWAVTTSSSTCSEAGVEAVSAAWARPELRARPLTAVMSKVVRIARIDYPLRTQGFEPEPLGAGDVAPRQAV